MARRRYVQLPSGQLVEVTTDYQPTPRNADHVLWNDRHYGNMRATDGTDISSRAKHREYMRVNGLTTADDFKETWAKAAKERADYFTGKRGSVTKEDIARAIHQLETRKK